MKPTTLILTLLMLVSPSTAGNVVSAAPIIETPTNDESTEFPSISLDQENYAWFKLNDDKFRCDEYPSESSLEWLRIGILVHSSKFKKEISQTSRPRDFSGYVDRGEHENNRYASVIEMYKLEVDVMQETLQQLLLFEEWPVDKTERSAYCVTVLRVFSDLMRAHDSALKTVQVWNTLQVGGDKK